MHTMTKAEELKMMAVGLGACEEGLKDWSQVPSDEELISRYVEHIRFCIKHDYPSRGYIKTNFSQALLRENGIFIDEKVEKVSTLKCIINGECSGCIEFDKYDVQSIYIRHESEIEIIAKDNSVVFVYLYDNAKAKVFAKNYAKICIFYFGGNIVKAEGNVVVRECRKEGVVE